MLIFPTGTIIRDAHVNLEMTGMVRLVLDVPVSEFMWVIEQVIKQIQEKEPIDR